MCDIYSISLSLPHLHSISFIIYIVYYNDVWFSSGGVIWTKYANNALWTGRYSFGYVVVPPYGNITTSTIMVIGGNNGGNLIIQYLFI